MHLKLTKSVSGIHRRICDLLLTKRWNVVHSALCRFGKNNEQPHVIFFVSNVTRMS